MIKGFKSGPTLIIILFIALTACGQKGALYLPDEMTKKEQSAEEKS